MVTSAFQTRPVVPFAGNTTVTLSTNEDSRATFEAVAKSAGLRIVFSSNFPSRPLGPFQATDLPVTDTLDLLSKRTGNFWAIWDSNSIVVAPDTELNRQTYDRVFLAVIEVPRQQDPKAILDALKGSFAVGNKIIMKNTFSGIERTSQVVADLLGTKPDVIEPVIVGSLDETFLTNLGSGLRSTTSKRSQLSLAAAPGGISLDLTDLNRTLYERLASVAGLNVVFGRNYPARSSTVQVENMDLFDALDQLALQSRSMWQPLNQDTIQVLEDTPQNRRDFELQQVEAVYLLSDTTDQKLNEVVAALRGLMGLRGTYQFSTRKAILLRDTPSNVLLAEELIAAIEGIPTVSKTVILGPVNGPSASGWTLHSAASTRALLKLRVAGTLPVNQNGDIRTIFESLSQTAGLSVVFGPRFPTRSTTFRVDRVDAVQALDVLAMQTGTFWQPLDDHTIFVAEDTQQNRRDYEVHLIKTIRFPTTTTTDELNNLMNVLRTAFSIRGIFQSSVAKTIVIHDTPSRVALVERIIRELARNPQAIVSLEVPAPGFAEGRVFSNAAVARPQLALANASAISRQLNQDVRASYETLAAIGGIRVMFDSTFNGGVPAPMRLEGVDIPDALDRLSLQTGNYWTVVDRNTVLVAADTAQVRQQYDPQVSRTISLKTLTQGLASDLVNVLRTVLSMRQVEVNGEYSITVKDMPQKVAIAEQIIANIDRP
jgi:hypothetical protein